MEEDICFYSVKAFSKLLGMSEQVLRKMIREGTIKSIRLNTSKYAKYRIPRSELIRLQSMAYGTENE